MKRNADYNYMVCYTRESATVVGEIPKFTIVTYVQYYRVIYANWRLCRYTACIVSFIPGYIHVRVNSDGK